MSGTATNLRPPAQNWQEVDLHVRYAQEGLARVEGKLDALLGLVPKMATTDYIDAKFKALADEYAPKSKVLALEEQIADIRREISEQTVESRIQRWGTLALKLTAIIACISATLNFVQPYIATRTPEVKVSK